MFLLPLSLTALWQPLVRSYRSMFLKLWAVKELKRGLLTVRQQQSAAAEFPNSAIDLFSQECRMRKILNTDCRFLFYLGKC